jgi:hypothetical protein
MVAMKNFQQIVAIGCFGLIWGMMDVAVINSYSHEIDGLARVGGLLMILLLILGSWVSAAPALLSGLVVWRCLLLRRQEPVPATPKPAWPWA